MDLSTLLDEPFAVRGRRCRCLQEAFTITRDTGNRNLEARASTPCAVISRKSILRRADLFERAFEIREKAKSPHETADTVHNLGDTFTYGDGTDPALAKLSTPSASAGAQAATSANEALASYGIGTILITRTLRFRRESKAEACRRSAISSSGTIWLGET